MKQQYTSENGSYEDEGYSITTNVSGQGLLPPGVYTVEVVSVTPKDGRTTLVLLDKARGIHTEVIQGEDWDIKELDVITVVIGLSEGLYVRKLGAMYAAFDATTHQRLGPLSNNIMKAIDIEGKAIATPSIKRINNRDVSISNTSENANEKSRCSSESR